MRIKFPLILVLATLLVMVLTTVVVAQGEPPSPYAGLKNPFPWDDPAAQETGKKLYQKACLGCHGAKGNTLPTSDFSTADFAQNLEKRPDFYFWVLSEGRLNKGMPPFKSSLSEEQRWQTLTYLLSLGTAAPAKENQSSSALPLAGAEGGTLRLIVPAQTQAGQPMTISAILQNKEGQPIKNATVKFLIKINFFATGLMEIGEGLTNDQGVASLQYTPRQSGNLEIITRYQGIESTIPITLAETEAPLHRVEAGFQLPTLGNSKDIIIGPKSGTDLGHEGKAPMTVFRLPGGIVSWLWLLVVTVMFIWFTYFRVMYQVFRIPIANEIRDTNTRLVPLAGLGIIIFLGTLLALMLLTGPYSYLNLTP